MAPESVNEGIFTTKSDIWSLGIIIYEVVTFGGFPYKELSNADVLDYIRSNHAHETTGGLQPFSVSCAFSSWLVFCLIYCLFSVSPPYV